MSVRAELGAEGRGQPLQTTTCACGDPQEGVVFKVSSSSGDGPPSPGRALATHPTPVLHAGPSHLQAEGSPSRALRPQIRLLPLPPGHPQSPPPAPPPDSCPAPAQQPQPPSPGCRHSLPGGGGAPGPRGLGLGIWKGWSDPLFHSASWAHLPGSLAFLFQNCLLFSAAMARAQGRPSRRASGVPGEMPPGSRNRRANPGRFPTAGQRLPAPGSAILDVGIPASSAAAIGGLPGRGRTSQSGARTLSAAEAEP